MDTSPDPTVVLTALKDLNMFLEGSRASSTSVGSAGARRLDFSASARGSTSSLALPTPTSPDLPRGQKRQIDSLVGFDVTKKIREKDSEIISTRATITRLEGRLHEIELENKKFKLKAEAEIKNLQHRHQREKELIDDLQHKLKKMQKAKEEAQERAESARTQWDTANLEAGSRVVKLHQTFLEQTNEMQEKITILQEQVVNLEREVAEGASKVTIAESHSENLEAQLTELQERLKQAEEYQAQAEDKKLQLNQALARVRELELEQEQLENAKKQQDAFEAAMRKLPVLKKELAKMKEDNKFLRDTARNTQLLEVQLTSALQQVKQLEERCEDRATLQAKAELYKHAQEGHGAIVINTDYFSALQALTSQVTTPQASAPNHHLTLCGHMVTLHWVMVHVGLVENERADAAACRMASSHAQ